MALGVLAFLAPANGKDLPAKELRQVHPGMTNKEKI
jgi:hypothetical protein